MAATSFDTSALPLFIFLLVMVCCACCCAGCCYAYFWAVGEEFDDVYPWAANENGCVTRPREVETHDAILEMIADTDRVDD